MATRGTSEAFMNVCDRELGIDDFYDVYDKIEHLSAHWKKIAISLHIKLDTISRIRANANGDTTACLQEVLEVWLKKDYDYERHGVPCWREVCKAVKKGGGDSALANEIAQEHPATGGATPHFLPATTGGAIPHTKEAGSTCISTPPIYVPKTIIDFKIQRELSEIQEQLAEAIQKTIEYYSRSGYDAPYFIDYITARMATLLSPHENTPDKAEAVRKEFKNIKTLKDFFGLLQHKYTSWFNHEPITKLVAEHVLEPMEPSDYDYERDAQIYWSNYKNRLHEYFKKYVTSVNSTSYGITDAHPGKEILIVEVDRGNYNQNDLYFLRKAIPPELDRPDLKLYLCHVLS